MPSYSSLHTGSQHDDYATKAQLVDLIYPVGSIYMSANNVDPTVLFGGTWQAIQGRFLLGADTTYTAGSEGGEATHTLILSETPTHTHTRGTMNITGRIYPAHSSMVCWYNTTGATGCFYTAESVTNCGLPSISGLTTGDHAAMFDASRNWTGETSSVGSGSAHNNMPPYLAVYIWKRIS